jgi:hypothetical protein
VSALAASARKTGAVLCVEEHNVVGGFGGAVAEALAKHAPTRMDFIGVQDRFTESGAYDALMKKYGISVEAIVAKAKALVAAKPPARKPAPAAAPTRKVAAKTVVKRKAVAKKSVARKAAAKKPAAKKVAAKKVVRKKAVAKRSVRKTR